MLSGKQSLSHFAPGDVPVARPYSFGVVVSSWNSEVTGSLEKGALEFLRSSGAEEKNIKVLHVPGSYELTMGAALLAKQQLYDAIICLGCVIQGETRHFDFICDAVANGITEVGLRYHLPVIFGVLTTNTQEQAMDRAGGRYGNKGEEAAATAIMMAELFDKNSL
jgi:6,7-dimethyl-8-ribityllumazine synthase